VVLRPESRVTAYHLGLCAACAAVAVFGSLLDLRWLPLGLWVAAAVQAFWFLRSAIGRVALRADSVRVWRLTGVTTVPVREVDRFVVWTTSFGTHVRLRRHGRHTVRLPAPAAPRPLPTDRFDQQVAAIAAWTAPRFGGAAGPAPDGGRPTWMFPVVVGALVVAVTLPDRPWGWVSFSDVAALPDVCAAVEARAGAALGGATGEPSGYEGITTDTATCRWMVDGRQVQVTLTRYVRSGLHSGSSVAATRVLTVPPGVAGWSTGQIIPVPGAREVGDGVLSAYPADQDDQPIGVLVVVRQANVVVEANLGEKASPDGPVLVERPDEERVLAVVRAVLAALRSE
jgi:hypothetical protein